MAKALRVSASKAIGMRALLVGWEECLAGAFADKWGYMINIVALKSNIKAINFKSKDRIIWSEVQKKSNQISERMEMDHFRADFFGV